MGQIIVHECDLCHYIKKQNEMFFFQSTPQHQPLIAVRSLSYPTTNNISICKTCALTITDEVQERGPSQDGTS